MRLTSFRHGASAGYGIVTDTGVIELGRRIGLADLRTLLGDSVAMAQAGGIASAAPPDDYATGDLAWLPVIPNPSQILCVGLNYRAHAAEVGRPPDMYPVIFLRVAASQVGHQAPIVRPQVSQALDFEGELAVIVGQGGRYIDRARALHHVGGYAVYNDASLRDWQRHTHQYAPGKNFPATGAFGPWLVTADEIGDPSGLVITTRLNGEVMQHAQLTDLIFPVDQVISYVSNFTELVPGDVILTGTPAGVGSMRKPPRWLVPGDRIEVEIDRIGTLSNPVMQEP